MKHNFHCFAEANLDIVALCPMAENKLIEEMQKKPTGGVRTIPGRFVTLVRHLDGSHLSIPGGFSTSVDVSLPV